MDIYIYIYSRNYFPSFGKEVRKQSSRITFQECLNGKKRRRRKTEEGAENGFTHCEDDRQPSPGACWSSSWVDTAADREYRRTRTDKSPCKDPSPSSWTPPSASRLPRRLSSRTNPPGRPSPWYRPRPAIKIVPYFSPPPLLLRLFHSFFFFSLLASNLIQED